MDFFESRIVFLWIHLYNLIANKDLNINASTDLKRSTKLCIQCKSAEVNCGNFRNLSKMTKIQSKTNRWLCKLIKKEANSKTIDSTRSLSKNNSLSTRMLNNDGNVLLYGKMEISSYENESTQIGFENCLLHHRKATLFFIFDQDKHTYSSRLLKSFVKKMSIREILSSHLSVHYYDNRRIVIKLKDYEMTQHFQNLTKSLGTNETLVIHPLPDPDISFKGSRDVKLLDKNCASLKQLDVSKLRFSRSCDVLHSDKTIKYESIFMWISLTHNTTQRFIYECIPKPDQTNWPFTIFLYSLVCCMAYFFFWTICYNNQGYIRSDPPVENIINIL